MDKKILLKKDAILIIIILAIGFSALGVRHIWHSFYSQNGVFAEIIFENSVETICLNSNKVFYLPAVPNVLFEVKDGRIAFVKSDCLDQICVREGFKGYPGQMAACLPNRLVLSVLSDRQNEVDVFVLIR